MSMRMAVLQRVQQSEASFPFLLSRSGHLLTKNRMMRSSLRSVPTEWTPALLVFPSPPYPALHEHFPSVVFLKHYLSYCWVFKIDEVPSAISVFIKGEEMRGSWVLACVWEVFVLTVWWLHTSLGESQMSLVCNGIIFLPLQRVFCVNLLVCLEIFKIKVKDNFGEQWNKIQSPHLSL